MKHWLRRRRAVSPVTAGTLPPAATEAASAGLVQDPLVGLIAHADALRDAGDRTGAAKAYAEALRLAPWRTDLTVQQGNMCKDAGRLPDAERLYGQALEEDPGNADIHLQLGHVMKLMGRRARALDCYRRALSLDPSCAGAHLELTQAGIPSEQNRTVSAQFAAHGIERMLSIRAELGEMQERIARIAQDMPDLSTWTAIPADRYALFRRLYDIPAAPAGERRTVRVVAQAERVAVERLHALLESLRAQTGANWSAVIHGTDAVHRAAVERVAVGDERIRWMQQQPGETDTQAERRAGSTLGDDDLLLLMGHAETLHPRAVEWFGHAAALTDAMLFCADLEETEADPFGGETPVRLLARGAFDPELLWQRNAWGDTLAVRATAWTALQDAVDAEPTLSGRRSALLFAAKGVAHLPLPLVRAGETADTALADHAIAAHRAAGRRNEGAPIVTRRDGDAIRLDACWPEPEDEASIVVLIPTRNNAADCARMVASLFARADRPTLLRCLVLDNDTDRAADKAILAELASEARVRILPSPGPFNWSALNNQAAQTCDETLLVFANDDMAMLSAGWDTALRRLLSRPEIGAVGAKLLYPDGTIQHGGILFGWQGSVIHDGLHEPHDSVEQNGRWQLRRRVSAVTGAFLCLSRALFETVGGFDAAQLPIGYSDVDLCLKLRARGLSILWEPAILLEHGESRSRGLDHLEREKQARDLAERRVLFRRWGADILRSDPSMNPVWHDATLPFRLLRPVDATRAIRHLAVTNSGPGTEQWRSL